MITATLLTSVLVAITILLHYEALVAIGHFRLGLPPRVGLVVGVFLIFLAHAVEIWVFAGGLYLAMHVFDIGTLEGEFDGDVGDYLYFSIVNYTTLGYGDIRPEGYLRLMCGFEALTGLLLIAWSSAYTVLRLQPQWNHDHTSKADGTR